MSEQNYESTQGKGGVSQDMLFVDGHIISLQWRELITQRDISTRCILVPLRLLQWSCPLVSVGILLFRTVVLSWEGTVLILHLGVILCFVENIYSATIFWHMYPQASNVPKT